MNGILTAPATFNRLVAMPKMTSDVEQLGRSLKRVHLIHGGLGIDRLPLTNDQATFRGWGHHFLTPLRKEAPLKASPLGAVTLIT